MRLFRSRRRSTQLPLTLCCITDGSPERTAAVVAGVGAQHVVVGVLPEAPAEASAYRGIADRVEVVSEPTREARRARLHELAATDWVLHISVDERPSPSLVASLPTLLSDPNADAWSLPRRIVGANGASWHDEQPWWPALTTRLVRRTADVNEPQGLVRTTDAPLLVLTAATRTQEEREELTLRREVIERNGPGDLRGASVRRTFPERYATRPASPLANEDADAVDAVVRDQPPPPPTTPRTTADTDAASLVPLERDLRWTAGEHRELLVAVHNGSNDTWSSAGDEATPRHRLSYRWRGPDGTVIEGMRTDLPRPLPPGDREIVRMQISAPSATDASTLELDVVHELVRWLGVGPTLQASVHPPAALPVRREIRVGGAPIPKVIHRVWLGDRPMPPAHVEYGRTWEQLHPDWEIRLWTDETAPIPACANRARSISEVSDLVRYELMRRHGGVYVDTDIECLRPIDGLIEGVSAFSAYEVPGRLCPALMGSVPGHPAFQRLCELVEITVGHGHYPENAATVMSTFVLEPRDDVTLFGPDRFYPQLWDGTRSDDGEPPYADHHWAMSWVP
jgi:hypothetical protein